jgi:hypothetical protein
MADLVATIGADLTELNTKLNQGVGAINNFGAQASQASVRAGHAVTNLGNSALSASMRMQQMRSGLSAARDGALALFMGGQRADMMLMAMGHHISSLYNETGTMTGAFKSLCNSLVGPGGVILGLTVAYEAYRHLTKHTKEAKEKTVEYLDTLNSVTAARIKGQESAQNELTRLKILYDATQNHKISLHDRNAAYDELETKYPKFFTNAEREHTLLGQNVAAYQKLAGAILAAAEAKAYEDSITTKTNRQIENKQKITDLEAERLKLATDYNKQKAIAEAAGKSLVGNTQSSLTGGGGEAGVASYQAGKLQEIEDKITENLRQQNNLKTDSVKLDKQKLDLSTQALSAEQAANFKTDNENHGKPTKGKIEHGSTSRGPQITGYAGDEVFDLLHKHDIEKLTTDNDKYTKSLGKTMQGYLKESDAVKETKKYQDELTESLKQQAIVQENGMQLAQIGADTLGNIFSSIADSGTNAFKAIEQGLVKMIEKLIIAVAEAAVFAAIMTAVTGGTLTFASALFGAGGSGGALKSFTGFTVPGHADGGITTRPHLAMVGEGKEKEAIMPLSKLKNFVNTNGGGGGQTIMHRVSGPDLLLWVENANKQKRRIGG